MGLGDIQVCKALLTSHICGFFTVWFDRAGLPSLEEQHEKELGTAGHGRFGAGT